MGSFEKEGGGPPVVVIGAGASGLTALKSALEEGLDAICFEKTDNTGGLWRYRKEVINGVASVMRSTVINSSKEMSCFSDFPPPADFPNFMHNKKMVEYFDRYAEHFDLRRHIHMHHEVLSVVQRPDFSTSGQWTVTVKNLLTNEEKIIIASGIMVCSGHHFQPLIPEFPGLSDFKGRVIHSHSYKDYKGMEDKRVLIVGIGNSAGDIAIELNRIASKVYLSTRTGTWLIYRVGPAGIPMDFAMLRRGIINVIPKRLLTFGAELLYNANFNHGLYNLRPKHSFFQQHPTVNDALPNCIMCGTVAIKSDIHRFTPEGVIFKGEESNVYEVDTVILATGYTITFPFIDESLIRVVHNEVSLYKNVFEPKIQPPTLAIIGLIQPIGSIAPLAELQGRWAARIFNKKLSLPPKNVMVEDIENYKKEISMYAKSQRHTIQVNYMEYMDDVGGMLGVKPNLKKMLLTDPKLFLYCVFGANVPYQYRLQGPHAWKGARETIINSYNRVKQPLMTRANYNNTETTISLSSIWRYIAMGFAFFMVLMAFTLA